MIRDSQGFHPLWVFKGGGGGSSGKVDYPEYIKEAHCQLLSGDAVSATAFSVASTDAIDGLLATGISSSPYSSFSTVAVFDPSTETAAISSAISALDTHVGAIDEDKWDTDVWAEVYGKLSEIWSTTDWDDYTPTSSTSIGIEFDNATLTASSDIASGYTLTIPTQADNIDAEFTDPTTEALSGITASGVLTGASDVATSELSALDTSLTLTADSDIAAGFTDPTPSASTDIDTAWDSPTPDADTDIATGWDAPSLSASTDISTAWEVPTPDAASDISSMDVDGDVDDAVSAFADVLDAQLDADVYPRFEAGMRDINAVVSSAFAVGRANIEEGRNKQVADYDGKLRYQATFNQHNKEMDAHIQADRIHAQDTDSHNIALAESYRQQDALNAQNTNSYNMAIAESYRQQDTLSANDRNSYNVAISEALKQEDAIASEAVRQENDLIGKAYLQEDDLNARVETAKLQLLGQGWLQYDAHTQNIAVQKNDILSKIYSQVDEINARSDAQKNELLARAWATIDDLNVRLTTSYNDVITRGILFENEVLSKEVLQKNESLGQAFMQNDQLNTSITNTKNAQVVQEASGRAQALMSGCQQVINILQLEAEMQKALAHYAIEGNRINMVAQSEETQSKTDLAVRDALWGFTLHEKAGNALASIAGASTVSAGSDGPSKAQSALGGAASGAAAGAMVGGPYGAVVGGVVGLAAGLMG